MEKDTPRKQALDQVQSQIESTLHEDGSPPTNLEAELELLSERWRLERRQLKTEIDRLERGAEEKMKETATAWEAERASLTAEVSRLQFAVGELLERTNNPKRAGMSVREELETKLNAAIQAKDRAVSGF